MPVPGQALTAVSLTGGGVTAVMPASFLLPAKQGQRQSADGRTCGSLASVDPEPDWRRASSPVVIVNLEALGGKILSLSLAGARVAAGTGVQLGGAGRIVGPDR